MQDNTEKDEVRAPGAQWWFESSRLSSRVKSGARDRKGGAREREREHGLKALMTHQLRFRGRALTRNKHSTAQHAHVHRTSLRIESSTHTCTNRPFA